MTRRSPLAELHAAALEGADGSVRVYGSPGPDPESSGPTAEVVETFGEVELEYAALRKSCVLIDLPHRATLELTGDDRLSFLNNMITGEVASLAPGRSAHAFWLSKKGRVTADMRLTEVAGSLTDPADDRPRTIVDLDILAAAETVETLSSYLIVEDAEITGATDRLHRLALHGPTGPLLLDGLTGTNAVSALANGDAAVIELAGTRVLVERDDTAGTIGLELTLPSDRVQPVYELMLASGRVEQPGERVAHTLLPEPGSDAERLARQVRLRTAGWFAYNVARIEAGTPLFNIDFGPDSVPHEAGPGMLASRVSFTKGCYLGQEVVSRMHHLGKPKRMLVALRPSGEGMRDEHGMPRQPVGGGHVYRKGDAGGASVGVITSSTISPMLGGDPVCFAMIGKAANDEDTELDVSAEGATLTAAVKHELRFLD